jgi:hypothetical protein
LTWLAVRYGVPDGHREAIGRTVDIDLFGASLCRSGRRCAVEYVRVVVTEAGLWVCDAVVDDIASGCIGHVNEP